MTARKTRSARVTINEIARRTGVSVQTVSRILGGMAHLHKPQTRAKVLKVAEELGYLPNSSARAMRTGRFGCVALVASAGRTGPLPEALLRGAHDELAPRDIHLNFSVLPEERLTSDAFIPKILRQLMVDGLLINYHFNIPKQMANIIEMHRIPAVWINTERKADCVLPDDVAAGRMATERLLKLGHKFIVYVDFSHPPGEPPEHESATNRFEGYALAMRSAGLRPCIWPPKELFSSRTKLELAAELISSKRPTGVVTYAETEALAVFAAAKAMGVDVPGGLSIVAIWDRLLDSAGWSIDTVVLPWYEVGRQAAAMLCRKLEAPKLPEQPVRVKPDLAEGCSAAPPHIPKT